MVRMISASLVAGWVAGFNKPATLPTCENTNRGWQVEIKPATRLTCENITKSWKGWQVFPPCAVLTRACACARAYGVIGGICETCHPRCSNRCVSTGETAYSSHLNLPPKPATLGGVR